eukprot:COSAG05_NODE_146_length_16405_cov_993.952104_2_plen_73_part_00
MGSSSRASSRRKRSIEMIITPSYVKGPGLMKILLYLHIYYIVHYNLHQSMEPATSTGEEAMAAEIMDLSGNP